MGKVIIDLVREMIEISGNPAVDSIIFSIIAGISSAIAFGLVGVIFDELGVYDSNVMSDANGFIKVIVFFGLTYVGVKIARIIQWLFGFRWWVYVIAGVVFIGIVFLVYHIKRRIAQRKARKKQRIEEVQHETVVQEEKKEMKQTVTDNSCYCPRCHSKLVKRHGPYGGFYGCESYGKTGCRYTRKYL